MPTKTTSGRTQVTRRKFYLVRSLQKNRIPIAGIQRETGLGLTSIREIRRLKTWPAWNAAKDVRNAARRKTGIAIPAPSPSTPKKEAPVMLPEPPYALASDLDAAVTTIKGDQVDLHKMLRRLRGAVYGPDDTNRITQLERQVEELSAFQKNVRQSGFLNRLINRAAKKRAKRYWNDR